MPKRIWFQFRLKSLFIIIAMVALPLGRFAYLTQRENYHYEQAKVCLEKAVAEEHEDRHHLEETMNYLLNADYAVEPGYYDSNFEDMRRHCYLAWQYRRSVFRPWTLIDDPFSKAEDRRNEAKAAEDLLGRPYP